MPNVNFGSFQSTVPFGNDFLVGFRDTSETRITVSGLTALNIPIITGLNNVTTNLNNLTTLIQVNTGKYDSVYTTTRNNSGFWSLAYTLATANSGRIQSIYTTLTSNSANWNLAYTIAAAVSTTPTDLLQLIDLIS